jgi:SPP1 family predicted phage head-tail adaptor
MNNAGDLNKRVEIWGKVPVLDSDGNPEFDKLGQEVVESQKLATVWAGMTFKKGLMLYGKPADTRLSKTDHEIKIRYKAFPEISAENWLIYDGRRFNIEYAPNPDFNKEFLEIYCYEVV